MKVKDLLNKVNYFNTERVIVVNKNGASKYDDLYKHYDSEVLEFIEAKDFSKEDIIKVNA